MKKAGKNVLVIIISFFGILLLCLFIIIKNSPGKLTPLRDSQNNIIQGAISEKVWLDVNGIRQGMFIRGENPENNPIILFLHGGPGTPELAILYTYETSERLEKYFTVCYWDQRGSGMSFNNSIDKASMNLEQFIEDTYKTTEYLKNRFNQEKIYLMGHSWGSLLGIKTIEKYPQNYLAFIGIGQVTNSLESERLSYDYLLQQADENNDKRAVRNLKKIDKYASDFPTLAYIATVRSPLLNKYGIGITHKKYSMARENKDILLFKGYKLIEKINYFRGMLFSNICFWDSAVKINLFESLISFQIPIYIIHGRYDYQVSYTLAKEYFDVIIAPHKEFYTFENSAHSPNMEEPEKFLQILRDIAIENKH